MGQARRSYSRDGCPIKMARFKPGNLSGAAAAGGRWKKGESGNPAGKSTLRREFEAAFAEALQGTLPPSELAEILVAAARKGEAFALAKIADYYLPSLKNREAEKKAREESALTFDFELLSDDERSELDRLLGKCRRLPHTTPGVADATQLS